jgi:3-oxoacyl-[acyl-carrier protein] reductase
MELNLKNKVVLITGSGQGLGKGIAEGFLAEGASVIISDVFEGRLEETKNEFAANHPKSEILTFIGDLTKLQTIKECVETAIDHFGRVDLLVANLGSGKSFPEWNVSEEEWSRMVELNFDGARKITNTVVPHMIEQGFGNVIYISSIAGREIIGAPVSYSVAKAAIIAYSKNISIKLAAAGIRINTICPGNIYFEGGDWDVKIKSDKEKVKSMLEVNVPLNRFATPEEISNLVLFLASEKSSFITGSTITIDGGQTITI